MVSFAWTSNVQHGAARSAPEISGNQEWIQKPGMANLGGSPHGDSQKGWFIRENPARMDDKSGYPYFKGNPLQVIPDGHPGGTARSKPRLHQPPLLRILSVLQGLRCPSPRRGRRPRDAAQRHGDAVVAATVARVVPGDAVAEVVPGEAVEHVPGQNETLLEHDQKKEKKGHNGTMMDNSLGYKRTTKWDTTTEKPIGSFVECLVLRIPSSLIMILPNRLAMAILT